jgi:putative flippase GtrA
MLVGKPEIHGAPPLPRRGSCPHRSDHAEPAARAADAYGEVVPTPAAVRRLAARVPVLVHELVKFGLAGAACFALDVAVFNVMQSGPPHLGPVLAKVISTAVSASASYFLNRHWTFRHRAYTGVVREYRLFVLLTVIGLLIAEACLGISHYLLGFHGALADNVSANGFGLLLGTAFRFWSYKRWVFLAPPPEGHDVDGPAPPTPAEETARTTV